MVSSTGGIGTAAIRTSYPHATGLDADSKHEGRHTTLQPQKSFIEKKEKVGIDG